MFHKPIKSTHLSNREFLLDFQTNECGDATNCHILIFVVQGGSVYSDQDLKESKIFSESFYNASDRYYPGSRSNMQIEIVDCPPLASGVLEQLSNIHCTSKSGKERIYIMEQTKGEILHFEKGPVYFLMKNALTRID